MDAVEGAKVVRRAPLDRVVAALFIAAGVLLFANLGNGYLWQDEAETAVLARNTLTYGYPRAFDGRNYVEATPFEHGRGDAWIYSPWLPFYALAGVFAIAGESTWAARLPFALFGFVSIFLTWRLSLLLTSDIRVRRLSVALLTCSVPFLLHMRQCRYYGMTTALLLGVCLSYLTLLKRPTGARAVWLGLLLVLLFHSNFGVFIPVVAAIAAHHLVSGSRLAPRRVGSIAGIVAACTLPWVVFAYQPAFVGTVSLERLFDHAQYYVRITNKYLVPLACMAGTSVWLFMTRRQRPMVWRPTPPDRTRPDWTSARPEGREAAPATNSVRRFLALLIAAHALFLLVPEQRHMRYIIPILPILVIGEAWWLSCCLQRGRLIGSAVVGLALFTNVLQSVHPRVPLAEFAYELTHRYAGPMEGIVGYLRQHGRAEDVAKIPYDDRTLMFYTDVQVERPSRFLEESYPEWVIIRRDWLSDEFFTSAYFQRIQATYERIELDAPDILWQNREDPGSHHFRTVEDAPRVVVYRKRST